jgi:hypothetical protein
MDRLDATPPVVLRNKLGIISRQELADATNRSVESLQRDARNGIGPRPIVLGQCTFYRLCDVERYLDMQVT